MDRRPRSPRLNPPLGANRASITGARPVPFRAAACYLATMRTAAAAPAVLATLWEIARSNSLTELEERWMNFARLRRDLVDLAKDKAIARSQLDRLLAAIARSSLFTCYSGAIRYRERFDVALAAAAVFAPGPSHAAGWL
jgi:hypothetical protein